MPLKSKAKKWHHLHPRTSHRAITLDEYLEQEKWDARIREAKAEKDMISVDPWTLWHRERKQ